MIRDLPISIVVNSLHSSAAWASAIRGTFTTCDGAVVSPAISNSFTSAGKSVAQMFILGIKSSVTTFTTNSPVRRMFLAVSFGTNPALGRSVTPMPIIGGSVHR